MYKRQEEHQCRFDGELAGIEVGRRSVADGAVADLVVVAGVGEQGRCRDLVGRYRPAVVSTSKRRIGAVVKEAAPQHLCQRVVAAEVGVVALPLPGYECVDRVVDVVVPLRRQPEAATITRCDQTGVVEVALGDE